MGEEKSKPMIIATYFTTKNVKPVKILNSIFSKKKGGGGGGGGQNGSLPE